MNALSHFPVGPCYWIIFQETIFFQKWPGKTFTIEKNWLLELWIRYPVKTFPSENYLLCMCKRIFTLNNFSEWNLPSVEMTWVLHFVIRVKLKSSSIFTSNCFYRYFLFLILNWCFKVFMGCAGWTWVYGNIVSLGFNWSSKGFSYS